MRIIHLTPGTGSFYCGTCLRDNALVAALRRLGHDALMIPMYLPPALDEPPATRSAPLFYGGVNVYLQQKLAFFRHGPRWIHDLLDSDRVLRIASARAGSTNPADLGALTVSMLRGEDGNQAAELDRLVEWLRTDGEADVVCLSNALILGLARRIRERTGAAVVCTLQGEDTFLDSLPPAESREAWRVLRERARDVDAFIGVSRYYADVMIRRAGLPPEKVHVVHNGIAAREFVPAPRPPDPPALGFLSRMCPAKGLHTLVDAYILLRKRDRIRNLKLKIAGSQTGSDAAYVSGLRRKLFAAGVGEEVEFHPNMDRTAKIAFLQGLSALSVPASYGEAFGLYVIEALAAGVPVVQPANGAFPELIEATGGGLLFEPGNAESLADSVEELLCDSGNAFVMGRKGRLIVHDQFTSERMAVGALRVFADALAARKSVPTLSR